MIVNQSTLITALDTKRRPLIRLDLDTGLEKILHDRFETLLSFGRRPVTSEGQRLGFEIKETCKPGSFRSCGRQWGRRTRTRRSLRIFARVLGDRDAHCGGSSKGFHIQGMQDRPLRLRTLRLGRDLSRRGVRGLVQDPGARIHRRRAS